MAVKLLRRRAERHFARQYFAALSLERGAAGHASKAFSLAVYA